MCEINNASWSTDAPSLLPARGFMFILFWLVGRKSGADFIHFLLFSWKCGWLRDGWTDSLIVRLLDRQTDQRTNKQILLLECVGASKNYRLFSKTWLMTLVFCPMWKRGLQSDLHNGWNYSWEKVCSNKKL